MMLLIAILSNLGSSFFMVWAFNVSFAAHFIKDNKSMVKTHLFSYLLILISLSNTIFLSWMVCNASG